MIMIANMNSAAIEDTAFSTTASALSDRSSKSNSSRATGERRAVIELVGWNGPHHGAESAQRLAAAFSPRVQALRPGLGHAFQQLLEFIGLQRLEANAGCFEFCLGGLVGLLHFLAGGGDDLVRRIDHRLLDFGRELFPRGLADRIGH